MCITLLSREHPDYALILINNRDEFLTRPTAPAEWWAFPNENVLAGRDLQRDEKGTWLGITREGRIAVLTNIREEGVLKLEARSRGAMVRAFLTQPRNGYYNTERYIHKFVNGHNMKDVGGFNLVCGRAGEQLAVISNRKPNEDHVHLAATAGGIPWILSYRGETVGLSNANFTDDTWPKVSRGEALLSSAIKTSVLEQKSQVDFVQNLWLILNDDTLPRKPKGYPWSAQVQELRESIFIPPIGGEGVENSSAEDLAAGKSEQHVNIGNTATAAETKREPSGMYGTQKQTIILVTHEGGVTFIERTLYDESGKPTVPYQGDRYFYFEIEGW